MVSHLCGAKVAPAIVTIKCPVSLTSCLPTGTAQFQSCYDATRCGGDEVTVSNARDCCLGSGLSFYDQNCHCRQCIGKQLHV